MGAGIYLDITGARENKRMATSLDTSAQQQPIAIISYHQIDPRPARGTLWRELVTPPERFRQEMQALARRGWRGVSMRELQPYLRGERRGKVVGLTFDDGFLNNMQALPILQAFGFTATLFAIPGLVGGVNEWDRPAGIEIKPLMGREHLQAWLAAGMEIGSHTFNHVDLTECDAQQAHHEIDGSRQALEDLLGCEVESFCFPYGRLRDEHVDMVRAARYTSACTCEMRRVQSGTDLLRLPRLTSWSTSPLPLFLARVLTPLEDLRRDLRRWLQPGPAPVLPAGGSGAPAKVPPGAQGAQGAGS
jgi:peptidoglycan/xylan/chitin deacetylase (PgdA/CDA1 family)